ncbi:hypothetical protein [Candidatus Nanohalovita haloferacivicina]|uniref:hypothetical protein n=1 Tax=Candidatus Nanohalovita haloferacivicina TaxID=2978046 RepID=UPI00325FD043|nr:hypothetical protein HBNXNv_0479 [Candidatus Nanohalobia archaeon BNXNv]
MSHAEGLNLEDAVGRMGGFNKRLGNDGLGENIERIRRDLGMWLNNEVFDDLRDKEIDLAIVYEYWREDDAVDIDNLVKPIVSALDGSSGVTVLEDSEEDEPYLVEDDSQIIRILTKKIKRETDQIQKDVKIDKTENGDWREAHGRITISFREHDPEKPMKMVAGRGYLDE